MDAPTDDQRILVPFDGEEPPAPAWFEWAMAQRPERHRVTSEGAGIEYLVWGEKGKPGLFLLHGGGAHAWWWAHLAPFFAADWRVAAMSMAGMGGSDWRDSYAIDQHARDMRVVAEAAGLLEAGPVALAGHSFGGAPTATAAADPEGWARQAIIIDSSLDMQHQPSSDRFKPKPRRYFDSLEEGLARFRFMPPQGCDNVFIADMIARKSLAELADGRWSWCFDPSNYANTARLDSRARAIAAPCPLAIVHGDKSWIMSEEVVAGLKRDLPEGTPFVAIPDSEHHVMVDQPLALVAAMRALLESA
ncbi:MAG: alpha/beta fold hydrolase [Parasphingopyxis sp.]|nr:alpha/beta hydrolase [Sphingomonadales bacterium]